MRTGTFLAEPAEALPVRERAAPEVEPARVTAEAEREADRFRVDRKLSRALHRKTRLLQRERRESFDRETELGREKGVCAREVNPSSAQHDSGRGGPAGGAKRADRQAELARDLLLRRGREPLRAPPDRAGEDRLSVHRDEKLGAAMADVEQEDTRLVCEGRGLREQIRERKRSDLDPLGLVAERASHELDPGADVFHPRDRGEHRNGRRGLGRRGSIRAHPVVVDRLRHVDRERGFELEGENLRELLLRPCGERERVHHRTDAVDRDSDRIRALASERFRHRGADGFCEAPRAGNLDPREGRERRLAVRDAQDGDLHRKRTNVDPDGGAHESLAGPNAFCARSADV